MLSEIFVNYGYFTSWFAVYVVYAIYMQGLMKVLSVKNGMQVGAYMQRAHSVVIINVILGLALVTVSFVNLLIGLNIVLVMLGVIVTIFVVALHFVLMKDAGFLAHYAKVDIRLLNGKENIGNPFLKRQNRLFMAFYVTTILTVGMYALWFLDGSNIVPISVTILPPVAPIFVFLAWEWLKVCVLLIFSIIPYVLVRKSLVLYQEYKEENPFFVEVTKPNTTDDEDLGKSDGELLDESNEQHVVETSSH